MIYINDQNWLQTAPAPPGQGLGLVNRDWAIHPWCESPYAVPLKAVEVPLIPRNEVIARLEEQEAAKSRLSDIRATCGPGGGRMPSTDQGSTNFCWAHSATTCVMLARGRQGLPYVHLSATMVASILQNYKNQGGWGAWALEFITANGVCSTATWPERAIDRKYDTPAARAEAMKFRAEESFVDLAPPVYDRNLTEDQIVTCALNALPQIWDFNWWAHSVTGMDVVVSRAAKANQALKSTDLSSLDLNYQQDAAVYASILSKKILNSWRDAWGAFGEAVLEGSRAIVNGGAAIRSVTASV